MKRPLGAYLLMVMGWLVGTSFLGKLPGSLPLTLSNGEGWQVAGFFLISMGFLVGRYGLSASRKPSPGPSPSWTKKSERELHFASAVLESIPGILCLVDDQGYCVRWNLNFEAKTGYRPSEIANMHTMEFFSKEDHPLIQERMQQVFLTGEAEVEAPLLTRDGRLIPHFLTGRRVEYEGRVCLLGMGLDISDRFKADALLRESAKRYRRTLDQILEGCQLLDFNWTYLYLNDVAALHNRRPNSELLGRTMQSCWPGIEQTVAYAMIERCMKTRTPSFESVEFDFGNGSMGWFDLGVQPVEEGVLVVSIDRTDRKMAEVTRDRLASIVESSDDAILSESLDAVITSWNAGAERMYGYTAEEMIGDTMARLLPEGKLDEEFQLISRVQQGGSSKMVTQRRCKDGKMLDVSLTISPILNASGVLTGVSKISRDITEQKSTKLELERLNQNLENEVSQRTAELQEALIHAKSADRLKSAFLATMSHELRTPLNSILGFAGILHQGLAGPVNEEQARQLGMVRTSARHLLDLINDVLDISKIEAGVFEIRQETFDVAESIQRVLSLTEPLARKKSLYLTEHVDPGLGQVIGDRRRFEQILINLLNNAVKFTDIGGVDLKAEWQQWQDPEPRHGLHVRVRDTGIGIQEEHLSALFQPFRQIDDGLTRRHEGSGLGLAICRKLIDLMDGEISVESKWGEGTEFWFRIPMDKPANESASPNVPEGSPKQVSKE